MGMLKSCPTCKPQLHIPESAAEWATNRELGWVVAESGWFGVNRRKFVVSRDDSWWFLADQEIAPKTLKRLKFWGRAPNQAESSWFRHDSWLHCGRVGRIRGSFGGGGGVLSAVWQVGAQSWLTRGSLGPLGRNMHADDSGVSRGRVGGGVKPWHSTKL